MQQDIAEQNLSRAELQDLRNKRTGLTIFQISWIMVFICLVIANWQLRFGAPTWPPPGVDPAPWLLPTVATVGLFASAWFARRGLRAIKADDIARFNRDWGIALGLGAAFVVVMGYEWLVIPYSGIYSDLFRVMTGFHGVHALAIGLFMLNIYRDARRGHYGSTNFWLVEGAASLWYFVLVAWIIFYVVLYWI
jgi:nitric oxide reductase NorE protein